MTTEQKKTIERMRQNGTGYARIAQELGVNVNTVKSFCRRNGLTGITEEPVNDESRCLQCGAPIQQHPGRKRKKFCSDVCRNRWWNAHLDQVKRRAFYSFTCAACGQPFESYGNSRRKYCSRGCAENARRADGR